MTCRVLLPESQRHLQAYHLMFQDAKIALAANLPVAYAEHLSNAEDFQHQHAPKGQS